MFKIRLLTMLVLLGAVRTHAQELTLGKIQAANAAAKALIQQTSGRLVVTYTQDRDTELLRSMYEDALAQPDPVKGARRPIEYLLSRVTVVCCRHERRAYLFDTSVKRFYLRVEDLRDLEAAVAEGRMPGDDLSLANASQTGIHLQDWDHFDQRLFWTQYKRRGGSMSVEVMRAGHRSIFDPPLDAGIVPAKFLEAFQQGTTTIQEIQGEGDPQAKIVCTSPRGRVTEATLDPEIEYRYRLIEERRPDGRMLHRYTADDFRDVGGGIVYPFSQVEEKQWNAETGKPMDVTRIQVKSAEFGVSLAPTDFSMTIPKGTRFWCLLNPRQRQYIFQRDATLTLDALMELAKKIDETTEATGLMNIDAFHRLIDRLEASPPPSTPGDNPP
jgi:hypothetical protein